MAGLWVKVGINRERWFPSVEALQEAMRPSEVNEASNVIDDSMPATWHPATGETLDSKRAFRARTKAAGCIEIAGANLNPGQKPVKVEGSDYEIGKALYDEMQSCGKDFKTFRKEMAEDIKEWKRLSER